MCNSYLILDTPGQIEIFTWSASGAIITDAIAASIPMLCCIRGGHRTYYRPGHLHVQHALRLLHPIQDQTALHPRFQQDGRAVACLCRGMDA